MTAEQQLDAVLRLNAAQVKDRETKLIEDVNRHLTAPPILFGAGALGAVALKGLRRAGVEPRCYVDNNPFRWGTTVEGLPVLSLAEAIERFGRAVPVLVTIYTGAELEARLHRLGLRVITFRKLALRFQDSLLPWCALELPSRMCNHTVRISEAFSLWADDQSREEYVAQVRFRYTLDSDLPAHLPADQTYFPLELVDLKPDEVFVDCGAFDGDSALAFLKRSGGWLKGVIAIEADPGNADRLQQSMSRLPKDVASKVDVIQAAVGAKNGTIRFAVTGTVVSHTEPGTNQNTLEVPCRKLDDLLASRHPSYIKMDIEGAEPQALEGCRQVIQKHAPVLAICLYHRQSDLWEIPLQIRAMTDRYQFFLRRYSDDCWEQVLYAIPQERVRR